MSEKVTPDHPQLPEYSTCPNCGQLATKTEWRPAPGIDPIMRVYECSLCHYAWYHIPKHSLPFPTPGGLFKTTE